MVNSELHNYFILFQDELDPEGNNYAPTWPQYKSPAAIAILKERVAKSGSLPSISAFIIAFDALVKEGALRAIRAARPFEKELSLSKEDYEKLSANEVIHRYRNQNEPEFKAAVDALIARGEI